MNFSCIGTDTRLRVVIAALLRFSRYFFCVVAPHSFEFPKTRRAFVLLKKGSRMFDVSSEPTGEQLSQNLAVVRQQMQEAAGARRVDLIAVSKTKSPECLKGLYGAGQRIFGENYVHEIVLKAPLLPEDIIWHFIGHLQSNKVKELLENVPNLAVVQTVDTEKLASKLNDGCQKYRSSRPLHVYIQVNTSGEESKSGTTPGAPTVDLAKQIQTSCPLLQLKGLMTIGMLDYTSQPQNFICLTECREEVAQAIGVEPETLELSMGMSADFENAIKMGATAVRVGTALFGQRHYPPKDKTAATA